MWAVPGNDLRIENTIVHNVKTTKIVRKLLKHTPRSLQHHEDWNQKRFREFINPVTKTVVKLLLITFYVKICTNGHIKSWKRWKMTSVTKSGLIFTITLLKLAIKSQVVPESKTDALSQRPDQDSTSSNTQPKLNSQRPKAAAVLARAEKMIKATRLYKNTLDKLHPVISQNVQIKVQLPCEYYCTLSEPCFKNWSCKMKCCTSPSTFLPLSKLSWYLSIRTSKSIRAVNSFPFGTSPAYWRTWQHPKRPQTRVQNATSSKR